LEFSGKRNEFQEEDAEDEEEEDGFIVEHGYLSSDEEKAQDDCDLADDEVIIFQIKLIKNEHFTRVFQTSSGFGPGSSENKNEGVC